MNKLSAEAYAIIEGRHSDPLSRSAQGGATRRWCAPFCPRPPGSGRSASAAMSRCLRALTMPAVRRHFLGRQDHRHRLRLGMDRLNDRVRPGGQKIVHEVRSRNRFRFGASLRPYGAIVQACDL
jgi:hypothetical protein